MLEHKGEAHGGNLGAETGRDARVPMESNVQVVYSCALAVWIVVHSCEVQSYLDICESAGHVQENRRRVVDDETDPIQEDQNTV